MVLSALLLQALPGLAQRVIEVDTASDSLSSACTAAPNDCSLRGALTAANSTSGSDVIAFNIPGEGLHTITLGAPLPAIRFPVVIDGYTQPGALPNTAALGTNARLLIEIKGSRPQNGSAGAPTAFAVESDDCTVKGLVINDCQSNAIVVGLNTPVPTGRRFQLRGCFLGTDASGLEVRPCLSGVWLAGAATNCVIGGKAPAERNLLTSTAGTLIISTSNNTIQGNLVGTDATGSKALGALRAIEVLDGSRGNLIGGAETGAGNVISGNDFGVTLTSDRADKATQNNRVQGNLIGLDASGTKQLSNRVGISVALNATENRIGGAAPGEGNYISGNSIANLLISNRYASPSNTLFPHHNSVQGNIIGLTRGDALAFIPSANNVGVELSQGAQHNTIGGTSAGARNVISGNFSAGVAITGVNSNSNTVAGNYIGTDVTGTTAARNGSGVVIRDGARFNLIGGTSAGARNIISGNNQENVLISGSQDNASPWAGENQVLGNYIGPNVTGTTLASVRGGTNVGIHLTNSTRNNVIGASGGGRNVIAGNQKGILIFGGSTNNKVCGNYVGLDAKGATPIGNVFQGIEVFGAANNQIGGTKPGQGNIIAASSYDGLLIAGATSTKNIVQGNYVGTDATGTRGGGFGPGKFGNQISGICVREGARDNTVGGATPGARNLVSGNAEFGIALFGSGANNRVQGNYIGTDASGEKALPNLKYGVVVNGQGFLIGGTTSGARNIIAGNRLHGVIFVGYECTANKLLGNYIGVTAAGTAALPNLQGGVLLQNGPHHNVIGSPGAGNVISGNGRFGISLSGQQTDENLVQSNYIGLSPNGQQVLGNRTQGVVIESGAQRNRIGGDEEADANFISGNAQDGIAITSASPSAPSSANIVTGNIIGLGVNSETNGFGNGGNGILIRGAATNNLIGGARNEQRNVISGNLLNGIQLYGAGVSQTRIYNNLIGTDRSGSVAISNAQYGVSLEDGANRNHIGGGNAATKNVISGNNYSGINLQGRGTTANRVCGNYLGLDATGQTAIYAGFAGVTMQNGANANLIGGTAPGERNVISGNSQGIQIDNSHDCQILGNYIGTDASGTKGVGNGTGIFLSSGAMRNIIGNSQIGGGNLISGNFGDGIEVRDFATKDNVVQNNLIGTDPTGRLVIGNGGNGIKHTGQNTHIGGFLKGQGNVIAGNFASGILLDHSLACRITGNFIGTDRTASLPMGNGGNGVHCSDRNIARGHHELNTNTIAFNGVCGVLIDFRSTQNLLRSNSIFANAYRGIYFERADPDSDINDPLDADTGANNLQNSPVVQTVTLSEAQLRFNGALSSTPNRTFTIEAFLTEERYRFPHQGQKPIHTFEVTTDDDGMIRFDVTIRPRSGQTFLATDRLTLTATDNSTNDTSEFSNDLAITQAVSASSLAPDDTAS